MKREFYAIQTLYTSPEFWDCLVPVLGREKLDRILKLSQTKEHKDGVKADVLRAVEDYGMYGAPWFVATRPDGKEDSFFGADKLENLAWWLGEPSLSPLAMLCGPRGLILTSFPSSFRA